MLNSHNRYRYVPVPVVCCVKEVPVPVLYYTHTVVATTRSTTLILYRYIHPPNHHTAPESRSAYHIFIIVLRRIPVQKEEPAGCGEKCISCVIMMVTELSIYTARRSSFSKLIPLGEDGLISTVSIHKLSYLSCKQTDRKWHQKVERLLMCSCNKLPL